jgi:hypothetical protein
MTLDEDSDVSESLERSIERLLEIQLVARAQIVAATELVGRIQRMTERLIGLRLATTQPGASPRAREDAP